MWLILGAAYNREVTVVCKVNVCQLEIQFILPDLTSTARSLLVVEVPDQCKSHGTKVTHHRTACPV